MQDLVQEASLLHQLKFLSTVFAASLSDAVVQSGVAGQRGSAQYRNRSVAVGHGADFAAYWYIPMHRVLAVNLPFMQAVVARASRPIWLPGSEAPAYLDRTLPADYGFDPLGLGENPETLKWYVQSELVHCRFAMAAVAGILLPGAIIPGFPQWYEAGEKALEGSPFPYGTLVAIEVFLMGWAESKRWMDIRKPGSQGEAGSFLGFEGMLKGTDSVGYPGGVFNPMGMGKDNFREMQTKVCRILFFVLCISFCLPLSCACPLTVAITYSPGPNVVETTDRCLDA